MTKSAAVTPSYSVKCEKRKCEERVALYPCDLRSLKTALKTHVQKKLFKWDAKLGGIVLSTKNIRKCSEKAEIHDESPVLFVPCSYRLKLLQVRSGDVFIGRVTQTFPTHITLQLFGLFNVLIYAEDISQKVASLKSNSDEEWVDTRTNKPIEAGDELQFDLKTIDIQEFGDFMLIASMTSPKRNGPIESIKGKYAVANHELVADIVSKSLQKF